MAISSKFKKDWGDVMKKVKEGTKSSVGFKDERFYKIDLGDTGSADVTIRFLPSKDTDTPWVPNTNHSPRGLNGWATLPCPKVIGKKCPICDWVWANYDKTQSKDYNKKFLKNLPSPRYYMNILIIKDARHPENEGKVFLYDMSKQIFEKFDEFHAEYALNHNKEETYIWDWSQGHDFRLKAKEKSFENDRGEKVTAPNYETAYFVDDQSPVGTEEYMEKIYEQMYDLSPFVDPSRFGDAESMIAKFAEITEIDISRKTGEEKVPPSRKEPPHKKKEEPNEEDEDDDSFVINDDDDDDSDTFFDDIK